MLLSQIQAPKVLLQRDNFLSQDEHLEEFGGKYFCGHTKNSESDALGLIRLSAVRQSINKPWARRGFLQVGWLIGRKFILHQAERGTKAG